MTARSQNGWNALAPGSSFLVSWRVPARTGEVRVTARNGSAGFLLAHFALWWAEAIEPLSGRIVDDWGYASRPIRGSSTTTLSNHASGTALDLNATQHPLGVRGTLTPAELDKIERRLRIYFGTLRHGALYRGRVDEMHVEIDAPLAKCEEVARKLMTRGRGKRVIAANAGQDRVILS